MRNIITTILFSLFTFFAFGQVVQEYHTATIATMKTYASAANRIIVDATDDEYLLCTSCSTDEVTIYAGAGGRKWKLISSKSRTGYIPAMKYVTDSIASVFSLNFLFPDYSIIQVGGTIYAKPKPGSGLTTYSSSDFYTVYQASIDALTPPGGAGSGGGRILIGSGTYNLTNEPHVIGWEGGGAPYSQLIIQGSGATVINQSTAGKNGLVIKNAAKVWLKDLTFTRSGSAKSCILSDSTGSQSEIGWFGGGMDNVYCYGSSATYPAVYLKNFFHLNCPWLKIENVAGDAMVLENASTSVAYGNSSFGWLHTQAANSGGFSGLKIISPGGGLPLMNLCTIDNYGCTHGTYGISTTYASAFKFLTVDIEGIANPIALGLGGTNTSSFYFGANGYVLPSAGGTGIYTSSGTSSNDFFLQVDPGGSSTVKPFVDSSNFARANSFDIVLNSPISTAGNIYIANPNNTKVNIRTSSGTTLTLPSLVKIGGSDTAATKAYARSVAGGGGAGTLTALTGDVTASGTGSVTATLARQLAPTAVKTTTYTAAVNDFIPCDNTSGSFTITLPSAPADKSIVGVKTVVQSGTNIVTVARGGSDVFNKAGGSTSLSLSLANQAMILQYKASSGIWYVISTDAPISNFATPQSVSDSINAPNNAYSLRNSKTAGSDSLLLVLASNVGVIKKLAAGTGVTIANTSDSLLTISATGSGGDATLAGTQTFTGAKTFTAKFTVSSTTQGAVSYPVMSSAQRLGITPAAGDGVYDNTAKRLMIHNGTGWDTISNQLDTFNFYKNAPLTGLGTVASPLALDSNVWRVDYSGHQNSAIGYQALKANTTGTSNSAFGYQSLTANTTGARNTTFGNFTMQYGTAGTDNTAVGAVALQNTTGNYNTGVGSYSLNANIGGSDNTSIGYSSGFTNTSGADNTAVGYDALLLNSAGNNNTAIGVSALNNSTADNNTAMGFQAMLSNTTGTQNTALGTQALANSLTSSFNIGIGFKAQLPVAYTHSGNIGHTIFWTGDNGHDSVASTTSLVGINKINPAFGLDVNGTANISGTLAVGGHATIEGVTSTAATGTGKFVFSASPTLTGTITSSTIVCASDGGSDLGSSGVRWNNLYSYVTKTDNMAVLSATGVSLRNGSNTVVGTIDYGTTGAMGLGTATPNAAAILDITSTTQGLLLPRMTKTQRTAISSPVAGLAIYQTDNTPGLRVYNGTNWIKYTETTD